MKISNKTEIELPPLGQHVARVYSIIDLGHQNVSWQGEARVKPQMMIFWELPNCPMAGTFKPEVKGKPFSVRRKYTKSLRKNASFRQDLESWKGSALTETELESFEVKQLLGKVCMVTLVLTEDGDNIRVDYISPKPKELVCPPAVNPQKFLSLDPQEFDQKVYLSLPEWLREVISTSPEFKEIMAPSGAEPAAPKEEAPGATDDVPF